MIIGIWLNVVTFMCTKLFPILLDSIDIHGCMMIFGIASTVGALFVTHFMKETSGRPLDDVVLNEKANTNRIFEANRC